MRKVIKILIIITPIMIYLFFFKPARSEKMFSSVWKQTCIVIIVIVAVKVSMAYSIIIRIFE